MVQDGSSSQGKTKNMTISDIDNNEDEWPSLATTTPIKPPISQTTQPDDNSRPYKSETCTPAVRNPWNRNIDRVEFEQVRPAQPSAPPPPPQSKLKSYQERADEYAKARLRILGSAQPSESDK